MTGQTGVIVQEGGGQLVTLWGILEALWSHAVSEQRLCSNASWAYLQQLFLAPCASVFGFHCLYHTRCLPMFRLSFGQGSGL